MLSLLVRCDLSTSTSLCLPHDPYSATFTSVARGRRWRQRHRKTRFFVQCHFTLCYLMLTRWFFTLLVSLFSCSCVAYNFTNSAPPRNWIEIYPPPAPPRLRPNFGAVANQTCVSLKNNSKYRNRVSTKKRAFNAVIKAYVLFYIHQTPGECEWRQFELNVYRYNKQVTQLFNNTQLTS